MKKTIFIIFFTIFNVACSEKTNSTIELKIGDELYNKEQIHSFLTEIYSGGVSPNITILNGKDRTLKYFIAIESRTYKNDESKFEYGLNLVKEGFIKKYAEAANLNLVSVKNIEDSDIVFVFSTVFTPFKDVTYFREIDLGSNHTEGDVLRREKLWLSLDQMGDDGGKPKSSYGGFNLNVIENSKYHVFNKSYVLIRSEDVNSVIFKLKASNEVCRMFLRIISGSPHLSTSCASSNSTIHPDKNGEFQPENIISSFDLALINALYSVDIAELDTAQAIDKIIDFLIYRYKV